MTDERDDLTEEASGVTEESLAAGGGSATPADMELVIEEVPPKVQWGLLVQVVLILALLGLGVVLYWRPASDGLLAPRWWHWVVLFVLFIVVVGMGTYRRRRRAHTELHSTLREQERLNQA
jgi:hypothetical protein